MSEGTLDLPKDITKVGFTDDDLVEVTVLFEYLSKENKSFNLISAIAVFGWLLDFENEYGGDWGHDKLSFPNSHSSAWRFATDLIAELKSIDLNQFRNGEIVLEIEEYKELVVMVVSSVLVRIQESDGVLNTQHFMSAVRNIAVKYSSK